MRNERRGLTKAFWIVSATCALAFLSLIANSHSQDKSVTTVTTSKSAWEPAKLGETLLRDPIWVYNNWSSYDELSDNVSLTEELAMRELAEIVRLKKYGVHFDYYVMDAFWFDPDSGYRKWRKPSWPDGPDRWIRECQKNGLKPGLWFGTNSLVKVNAVPQWKDSLAAGGYNLSFSEGGFLPDFMETLQFWYDRGIRMFKFDFVTFDAATPEAARTYTKMEVRQRNETALREALKKFRAKNPDVILVAYNGFGGDNESTASPFPFRSPVDLRWLSVFDSLYSGDPRPSDVPQTNFWRSLDIYADHMVRRYEQSGVPLERVDPSAMMVGSTGTIYYRKTNAWKGMLWLTVARGTWVNTIHGNLELLDEPKAKWFARVQRLYESLQAEGRTKTFGGIPGNAEPYGFGSVDVAGSVYTVMNPAQSVQELELPQLTRAQAPLGTGRIIFRDAGFIPILKGNRITLGPGQLAAIGFGKYEIASYDFGVQEDVVIPKSIVPVKAQFSSPEKNTIEAVVQPPPKGDLRILFQQHDAQGNVLRNSPGAPPNGKSAGKVLVLTVQQNGKPLPIDIQYDRQIWSGLSWGSGEIRRKDFSSNAAITIRCFSAEKDSVKLTASVYAVQY